MGQDNIIQTIGIVQKQIATNQETFILRQDETIKRSRAIDEKIDLLQTMHDHLFGGA